MEGITMKWKKQVVTMATKLRRVEGGRNMWLPRLYTITASREEVTPRWPTAQEAGGKEECIRPFYLDNLARATA